GPSFSRPTAATTSRIGLSARLPAARACPHFFEIVEGAHLRPEHVDDDVAGVDQHPVGLGLALDADIRDAGLFQALHHAVGAGADVAVRPAAGDDHGVGARSLAGEIDGDGVLGLHVVEAVEDQANCLLGAGTLGVVFGRA